MYMPNFNISNYDTFYNSVLSSPMLNAIADVTPLPSPIMSEDSPERWNRRNTPTRCNDEIPSISDSALVTQNGESISSAIANQIKRLSYHGLLSGNNEPAQDELNVNEKNRSESIVQNISQNEYVSQTAQLIRNKSTHVSGTYAPILEPKSIEFMKSVDLNMRREPNLAVQRGLEPIPRPPTPPPSRKGPESSDSDLSLSSSSFSRSHEEFEHGYFDAYSRKDMKLRRWKGLKLLGEGTFSKVILAISQNSEDDLIDACHVSEQIMKDIPSTSFLSKKNQGKLVAVKICEYGPKGGASEERVEKSVKREIEFMKDVSHPSVVHLKAWNIEDSRVILILGYSPGGDLFEVASGHYDLLVPDLLRRVFSELVAAVRYLHERHIVHRDIKLENVLVNLPYNELRTPQDWRIYPYSVVTLTDLGLARRIKDDEKLITRCGSNDYAAPEVIMGQAYDGRATDAWSLGVLLYALLESRLPFDTVPGMPESHKHYNRTNHRIARVEWCWVKYAGLEDEHEADPEKFRSCGLVDAMHITEGLLKRARNRWTLEQVADTEWVKGALQLKNGIKSLDEKFPVEMY